MEKLNNITLRGKPSSDKCITYLYKAVLKEEP